MTKTYTLQEIESELIEPTITEIRVPMFSSKDGSVIYLIMHRNPDFRWDLVGWEDTDGTRHMQGDES